MASRIDTVGLSSMSTVSDNTHPHPGPSPGTVEHVDGGNAIEDVVVVDDPRTFNVPWWGNELLQDKSSDDRVDLRGEQPKLRKIFQAQRISDAGGKDARLLSNLGVGRTEN
jgi:hypothetical protein